MVGGHVDGQVVVLVVFHVDLGTILEFLLNAFKIGLTVSLDFGHQRRVSMALHS